MSNDDMQLQLTEKEIFELVMEHQTDATNREETSSGKNLGVEQVNEQEEIDNQFSIEFRMVAVSDNERQRRLRAAYNILFD